MKDSDRYAKIVEWSEEDQCYVGTIPGLIDGGCHGDDEKAVFAELCQVAEEAIELYKQDNKPLPPPTIGRVFATGIRPFPARGNPVTNELVDKLRQDDVY